MQIDSFYCFIVKRMELLKLKSKPHLSQESKSEAIQCQRKSDNFRRSNLLLRTFAPWCRLVDQARYFNSKKKYLNRTAGLY